MKKVTVSILLFGIMLMAVPAIAQDFGTEVPLTFPGGETKSLWKTDWSPDGKWIAFGQTMDDGEYHKNIWIVSTADGSKKNLTGEIEDNCSVPIFTPDGSEVIFSRLTVNDETKQAQSALESINIKTGEHNVVLEEAFAGSISGDGKYLSYVYWPDPDNHENMTHALYNFDDNETVYFDFWENEPAFNFGHSQMSPDNSHFVTTLIKEYENFPVNSHAIFSVSLDGSIIEEITSDGDPWYPKYSPDGEWILFTRFDFTDKDIERNKPSAKVQLYNTETGEITDLLADNSYFSSCGSWSPDGSKICYILDDNGDYSLYIKDFQDAADEIQVSVENETPSGFALRGNYPNPFNPSTTIEFSLPEAGFADLDIYNLAGQKVRELVSGAMSKGIHSVVWNGRDGKGLPVSAGMYLTRLRMGDAVQTDRMILVK